MIEKGKAGSKVSAGGVWRITKVACVDLLIIDLQFVITPIVSFTPLKLSIVSNQTS
jgi:hypothetical protein